MSRSKLKASPRKGDVIEDDEDLDLFCRLEKAIHDENSGLDTSFVRRDSERSRLAEEFPDCFIETQEKCSKIEFNELAEYQSAYKELQEKIAYVSRKKEEVDRNASFISKERRELERKRARLEKEKVIAQSNLGNVELVELRRKYEALKRIYQEEKQQWQEEKERLLAQIESQESSIHVEWQNGPKILKSPRNGLEEVSGNSNNSKKTRPDTKSAQKKSQISEKSKHVKEEKKPREPLHEKYQLNFDFDPGAILKEDKKEDGRKLVKFKNGMSGTRFKNGTIKMKNGDLIYVFYENGDKAIEFNDRARGYWYKETDTIELSLPDQTMMYQFSNGQIERHFPNGDKAVQYPNGQFKILHSNGDYEVHHPSGKTEKYVNGNLVITFEE